MYMMMRQNQPEKDSQNWNDRVVLTTTKKSNEEKNSKEQVKKKKNPGKEHLLTLLRLQVSDTALSFHI